MTVSTDGILVFGFHISEEGFPEWMSEHDDFEDWLLEKLCISSDAPYEDRAKIIEACPAELYMHCSYDYPMYVLGPRGFEYNASRGDPFEITASDLNVAPEKIAAFKAWCETYDIEYQEPKWFLCSLWG